jgi:hypothetical protein
MVLRGLHLGVAMNEYAETHERGEFSYPRGPADAKRDSAAAAGPSAGGVVAATLPVGAWYCRGC